VPTRFARLAAASVVVTLLLVTIGVVVRVTGSGLGCPDWPFCYGELLPPADDAKAWIEWTHRSVAALLGLLVLGLAILAAVDHRDRRTILWPSIAAVGLVGFQAYLGRETVRLGNSGESVTAHLAAAMALLGLLVYLLLRAGLPARATGRAAGTGGSGARRYAVLASITAAATYAVLLLGSNVTALGAALVFPDWPLMGGSLVPSISGDPATAHVLHRWVAGGVLLLVAVVAFGARRTRALRPTDVRLAAVVAALYAGQIVVGGLQVLTGLAGWSQVAHVALGATIWAGLVALAVSSWHAVAPVGRAVASGGEPGAPGGEPVPPGVEPSLPSPGSTADTLRAYLALTKPRIIELLLVTTVPAMVLATRDRPGIEPFEWAWLVVWTLVAGGLAAGAANALNQVLDRDLDLLMSRTRRRPLPAQTLAPRSAVVFGISLGVISIGLMAALVNVVAAFLTLVAILFYVFVYTIALKRSTPQNIVIGGAAGALPPVIGWAAVTGDVSLPAIMLFLIVFYWTPPHFWALSLRIRRDYQAAGVPMLPVVRGVAETSRQIGLYTVLLVAVTLVFAVVAQMGLVYLAAAVVLGGMFLWRAFILWRQGTSPDGSTAQAIRLYRFSIGYLALLFAAVAVDALVVVPLR